MFQPCEKESVALGLMKNLHITHVTGLVYPLRVLERKVSHAITLRQTLQVWCDAVKCYTAPCDESYEVSDDGQIYCGTNTKDWGSYYSWCEPKSCTSGGCKDLHFFLLLLLSNAPKQFLKLTRKPLMIDEKFKYESDHLPRGFDCVAENAPQKSSYLCSSYYNAGQSGATPACKKCKKA
ncbi:hypothetical protein CROQUDRAFT_691452 [Cronartium quercuum f. sp. fusiforme G11]|uniref:Uncharacterized protein n=1 Tax=Cronartium quercuum f. sp. fusiforme G11 TaxID=708437 RepID=A0A9P6NRH3_9BASI|nr:hypothetical protein CROQUDRAFT_691452 [Cronartium quercuum f. sp. fusiforme G11]